MLPILVYGGNSQSHTNADACQKIIGLSVASCHNDWGISSAVSCTFVPSDWQTAGLSPSSLVLADRIPAGVCLQ